MAFPRQKQLSVPMMMPILVAPPRRTRFFYPTVSGAAIFKGNAKVGIIPNKVFGTLDSKPMHLGFTLNSDTPYAPLLMDLSGGPMVVELPPGALILHCHGREPAMERDLGLPGPAAGKGDKVVFLPPGDKERDTSAGSLYWLGLRDNTGATLDGGRRYRLNVPQPVPGKLFWSVTVYDTREVKCGPSGAKQRFAPSLN
jgi:hypothetical protein